MKKNLSIIALLIFSLSLTSYIPVSISNMDIAIKGNDATSSKESKLTGITVHPAPAPPSPYTKSVYFKYNNLNVGNKFKVVSDDGCPFYTVVNGSPVTYTAVTSAENIFGVFFKAEAGCSQARSITVYYNDNGTWVSQANFIINL
ncbi:hypothetical protein [Niabella hibiscisoli]|uniref:hypothetical protein n=1 Tax=Niabella hibiscisoli TaxID=1825928 RepID=UPI001F0E27D5|nr:hypothetical protein [Niabella hibiscisoli]MCH5716983.1 hypothetical protein [Niabella hibiscisoli]